MPISVEDFIRHIATETAKESAKQPPRMYTVNRNDPLQGQKQQTVSLPQIMAELCDALKFEAMARASHSAELKNHTQELINNNQLLAGLTIAMDKQQRGKKKGD